MTQPLSPGAALAAAKAKAAQASLPTLVPGAKSIVNKADAAAAAAANTAAIAAGNTNVGTYFYVQPAFDKRLNTMPFLAGQGSGGVRQGYMIWDTADAVPGYSNKKAVVNFLYNPTTIDVSYGLDITGGISGNMIYTQAGDQASAVVPIMSTLSFALLFDRTFDLWGTYNTDGAPKTATPGNPAQMNDPGQGGVNVDIMAFKQITGQLADQPNGAGNGQTTSGTKGTTQNYNIQGPMSIAPTWCYLGPPSSGMFYYGYITSWDVTITHWSQYMVPMRCTISVGFQLMPPPWTEPLAGNNPSQWWSLQSLAPAPVVAPKQAGST